MTRLETIVAWMQGLQDRICAGLEHLDGRETFQEDHWERPGGGGGRSRAISGGDLIAKGGVNFSHVFGPTPESLSANIGLKTGTRFDATGVSIVLHARSPWVPTIHMNVRYFEAGPDTWWFGGGIDLTPVYVNAADARTFHAGLKAVCDAHDPAYYPRMKAVCDTYFYLRHRQETRGIGGIFYDHFHAETASGKEKAFAFTQAVGDAFVDLYAAQTLHRDRPWGAREQEFQEYRRARYVEFNLLWDKGTRFGIETDGRTESILMSMPPIARWDYMKTWPEGSPEAESNALLRPQDWLAGAPAQS